MLDRRTPRLLLTSCLLAATLLMPWGALHGDKAATKLLGGKERYLTFLSTDKPIYRPGETVYIRGVMLHHSQRTPRPDMSKGQRRWAQMTVIGPKGSAVTRGNVQLQHSVLGTTWKIPQGMAGGQYKIKVRHHDGQPPAERSFDVRVFRAPRLNSEILFLRKGYGPGDTAVATLAVTRAEGGVPAGAKISAMARVDGRVVWRGKARLDRRGFCTVRFPLPARIVNGEGTLAMVISDGGIVETAAKTIPILLRKIDLVAYPEGGELVAGLGSRVYLEARTPWGKPADVAGQIVDSDGRAVASFRTAHEGRARCEFLPAAGKKYTARITRPAGIDPVALPAVKASGGTIAALADVTAAKAPVQVLVSHTRAGNYLLTLSRREAEVDRVKVDLAAGKPAKVALEAPFADGVLRVTLWTDEGKPVAERLVYRQPARQLRIEVTPDKKRYVPGSPVTLEIKTTDGSGKPVGAVVGLTVTDERVRKLIEKRERAPRLPVMVLLEGEVRELADAHVYLDARNPEAPRALDLLLGTQGWRRFAFVKPAEFSAKHGEAGQRVLALRINPGWGVRQSEGKSGAPGAPDEQVTKGAKAKPTKQARPNTKPPTRTAKVPPRTRPTPTKLPVAKNPQRSKEDKKISKKRKALSEQLRRAQLREEKAMALGGRYARRRALWISLPVIREYAHKVRKGRQPGDRVDFTETVSWHAGIKTDEKTGAAKVTFALSDSVTRFAVRADGFDARGAVAQGDAVVESVEPFYIAPKLPLEVTAGDTIRMPIGLVNGTSGALEVALSASSSARGLRIEPIAPVKLAAGERGRALVTIKVTSGNGPVPIRFTAKAGPYGDQVTRELRIAPLGFPAEITRGGHLPAKGKVSHTITVPADAVPHSMTSEVVAYPSPLANLTQALQSLIREPYG